MSHSLTHLFLIAAFTSLAALHAAESYTENPGKEGNGAFEVGPEYRLDPDLTDKGNAKGKTFTFSMKLADSKVFDGTLDQIKGAQNLVRLRAGTEPRVGRSKA